MGITVNMISKKNREIVGNKYGGKCAYCGESLQKGWHVDEFKPVIRRWEYIKDENGNRIWDASKKDYKTKSIVLYPERFNIDNQMPACASCNINKRDLSLDDFRKLISGFITSLNRDSVQYKIAKRYGLIKEELKPVVFYFETIK